MSINFSTPFVFAPSTTISSSDMNQNFSYIKSKIDDLEALTATFTNLAVDTTLRSGGTIQSADGAVGAPGFTFTNDTDTGLYRIGSNNIALSAGNTKVVDMTTAGVAVYGTTTNNNASAGFIGEIFSNASNVADAPATGVWADVDSLALTAGDWDVYGAVTHIRNTATWTQTRTGLGTTSGDNAPNLGLGALSGILDGISDFATSSSTPNQFMTTLLPVRVSIASTTTVYLKVRHVYSAGQSQRAGAIWARRAR